MSYRSCRGLIPLVVLMGACGEAGPPEVCREGAAWDGERPVFVDASEAWGLRDIDAAGIRISAVDFDGDGWTDLAVRADNVPDDFAEGGARQTWLLRNTGDGRFVDVTEASGIRTARLGDGSRPGASWAFGDVDNDGDLDVYTGLSDRAGEFSETSEIMLNDGTGQFQLGPEESAVRSTDTEMPYGVAFTDVDRDGVLDLWVAQYADGSGPRQDKLYRGTGQGAFDGATRSAGLRTEDWTTFAVLNEGIAHSNAWAAAACDLNNDGSPELLASSYGRAPNHLWLNDGAGAFTSIGVSSGYAFDDRTDWTDNESARCWCSLHPSDEDCAGVPAPAIACMVDADAFRWNHANDRQPFRLGGNSGATVCADINNDGHLDLLTTEIVHWDVGSSSDPSEILWNTGASVPAFERPGNDATGLVRERTGATWDDGDITASVFDFDNDGWPDIYLGSTDYAGTRGLLFHQQQPESFVPVPLDLGIDHRRSHGSAVADFDRDGDLDVVVGHSRARCGGECYESFGVRLFENQMSEGTNWLQLSLSGTTANRAAIGARVSVTAGGVTQTQEIGGGHGQWGNQDDLVLHFGLGAACEAEVSIRWPDAALTVQELTLGGGYRYRVEQGDTPVWTP